MSTHIPAVPAVLNDPLLNHGAAFTAAERKALALTGRLPSAVLTLEEQARRAWQQLQAQPSDLAKNVYTEQLHDRNEVLYYRLLLDHLAELLPIVYDPAVGDAIEQYSDGLLRTALVRLRAVARSRCQPVLAGSSAVSRSKMASARVQARSAPARSPRACATAPTLVCAAARSRCQPVLAGSSASGQTLVRRH